jgi:hypothetical protein
MLWFQGYFWGKVRIPQIEEVCEMDLEQGKKLLFVADINELAYMEVNMEK